MSRNFKVWVPLSIAGPNVTCPSHPHQASSLAKPGRMKQFGCLAWPVFAERLVGRQCGGIWLPAPLEGMLPHPSPLS